MFVHKVWQCSDSSYSISSLGWKSWTSCASACSPNATSDRSQQWKTNTGRKLFSRSSQRLVSPNIGCPSFVARQPRQGRVSRLKSQDETCPEFVASHEFRLACLLKPASSTYMINSCLGLLIHVQTRTPGESPLKVGATNSVSWVLQAQICSLPVPTYLPRYLTTLVPIN
jgi:hypothetical protein